jgi:hypothetical protein
MRAGGSGFLTVVLPEELVGTSSIQFLRRRSGFWLKASLLFEAGVVVTNVPHRATGGIASSSDGLEPLRHRVLVLVSGVHAATAQAVAYARTLDAASVEALIFSTDPEGQADILDAWGEWRMGVPLSIVEAPFRDLTGPVLEEIRRYTARGGTVVTAVIPELVVRRWWEHLLHNQTALFLKRLLLFEPNTVVTSVPFHLAAATEASPDPVGV